MPRVPQSGQPSVSPGGAPGARVRVSASPASMGAGLGQGLQALGGDLAGIAAREKQRADAAALTEMESRFAAWENERIYDPEEGALTVKGKDALDLPETVIGDFEKFTGELQTQLGSDEQRQAFEKLAARRRADIERTMMRHASQEYQVYDKNQTDAALASSLESAANNYNNPDRISTELERQRAYILSYAQRSGEAPEVTERKIEKMESDTHVSVIDRMLAKGDYRLAEEYYDANGEVIAGTDRDEVEKALETASLRGESQERADELTSQYATRDEALRQARAIDDPKLRDETVRRVNSRFDEKKRIEQENHQVALERAEEAIEGTGNVDDVPPDVWAELSSAERRSMEIRAPQVQEGVEPAMNYRKWTDFMQKTPGEIADMDLYTELRPYVDDAHYDRAVAMKADVMRARRGDNTNLTRTLTFKDRVDNTLRRSGVIDVATPSKMTDVDSERYARFETEASRRIELEELRLNRQLSGNEQQEVIDDMVMESVFVDESIWSGPEKLPLSVLNEEDLEDVEPPSSFKQNIRNLALSEGVQLTSDQIRRAYIAAAKGNDDLVTAIIRE